jgi:hypothetical protein
MLFNVQSELAEILGSTPATLATPATIGQDVARVAGVAAQRTEIHAPAKLLPFAAKANAPARTQDNSEGFSHGVCAITGRPRTWTGKIVALDEWRRLSEWEREGPAGRLFCGLCRKWVEQGDGCSEAGCRNRHGAR